METLIETLRQPAPKIKNLVRSLSNIILAYSAINNRANPPAPYSILNPETSSDSPSAKSKGVRLVSATQEIIQTTNRGAKISNLLTSVNSSNHPFSLNLELRIRNLKIIKAKLISYEIVWATPRIAPTVPYFLLEVHPDKRRGYKFNPIKTKSINREYSHDSLELWRGRSLQIIRIKKILTIGLNQKIHRFPRRGLNISLVNSFTASAKGWRTPPQDTLLGPFRLWEYPNTFRSSNVKKATFTSTGIKIKNSLITLLKMIIELSLLYIFSVILYISYMKLKIIKLRFNFVKVFVKRILFSIRVLLISYISSIHLNSLIYVEWEILRFDRLRIVFPIFLDKYSILFISSVMVIARAVFTFSLRYMAGEKFFLRFHLLVIRFVLSIILLIISPNLISLLIGWDGLGVTSYLLVIYFQNSKAYGAGIITALTNRIGDVLILIRIALIISNMGYNFWANASNSFSKEIMFVLIFARITKRAQIPFSAWLPAAIAAPTPVSSLVHSSTLVTAGVYLIFRLSGFKEISYILFILGVSTIIIARLSALWETDIKKIVALSTLSQLGLIFSAIGLSLFSIAFFHLLTHAYFKALLFIAVGNSIHLSNDYQDLRKVGLRTSRLPITLSFALVANLRLCGLPFLGGFYSKDSILENISIINFSLGSWLIFYGAVILTVVYSFRFSFIICFKTSSREVSYLAHDNDQIMRAAIILLIPLAIFGGRVVSYSLFIDPFLIILPLEVKNLTLILISSGILVSVIVLNKLSKEKRSSWSLGRMWALPFSSSIIPSYMSLKTALTTRKLDLIWVPFITLTPIRNSYSAVEIPQGITYINFAFKISRISLLLILLYICVIKLIIFFKIKT